MGVGLLFWIALLTFPILDELMRRDAAFTLVVFVAIAPGVIPLYPDLDADLQIVRPVKNGFVSPLYGRRLSNQIVGIATPGQFDETCAIQGASGDPPGRNTLIVDQSSTLTKSSAECEWVCEVILEGVCLAGKLTRVGG